MNTRAGTEVDSEAKRNEILDVAMSDMLALWRERAAQPPRPDLISMLAHGEATRDATTFLDADGVLCSVSYLAPTFG